MVSFDVVSINIILRRIYEKKEIVTDTPKSEMCALLYLCTKNMHFTFSNKIYIQNGVAMSSSLGPVLVNVFMAELESAVIPNLSIKYLLGDDLLIIVSVL